LPQPFEILKVGQLIRILTQIYKYKNVARKCVPTKKSRTTLKSPGFLYPK